MAVLNSTAAPDRSSAPKPVAGSAETTRLPLRTGREPTQIGTVSTCAESMRRGPRTVPGSLRTRFPVWPATGVRRWTSSTRRVLAGCAGVMQLAADEIHDGRFLAAAARYGHHLHHQFESIGIGQRPMIESRFSGWRHSSWKQFYFGLQDGTRLYCTTLKRIGKRPTTEHLGHPMVSRVNSWYWQITPNSACNAVRR